MSLGARTLVLVRGAGDLATGVIVRLVRAGFRVAALEIEAPTAIRRTVALSEAVYEGEAEVEGLRGLRVGGAGELDAALARGQVPILVDPRCAILEEVEPLALVDAIVAKRNLGTAIGMAPIVVALGPGFEAGADAHAVVETNRGHDLGRVILKGRAEEDTGVPGIVGGYGAERVVRSPAAGELEALHAIGDLVEAGEPILAVRGGSGRILASAAIRGVLRGMMRGGVEVPAGFKVADVDPRCRREHCFTVSDKARAIGGGVLEAIMLLGGRPS